MARFTSIWQLKAAAITLFFEAAALVAGSGYFVYGIITGQARLLPTLAALAGFTALAAIWFISLGVGLITQKATTRTPAMFAQMIPLSIAFGSTSGENASALVALGLAIPGVFVISLLFSKPVGELMNKKFD
ncbi:MAG: hypothetical protein RI919_790 [Actinomycetota bacterium]